MKTNVCFVEIQKPYLFGFQLLKTIVIILLLHVFNQKKIKGEPN